MQNGTLLNTDQGNCQKSIKSTSSCPKDNTGNSGQLIHHLLPFECGYSPTKTKPSPIECQWNAVGTLGFFIDELSEHFWLQIGNPTGNNAQTCGHASVCYQD